MGAALGLATPGCENTRVASFRPADGLQLDADEAQLWADSRREAARLDASGFVLPDPVWESYLHGLLQRLAADHAVGGVVFRAKVLVDPTLNAFALPNGELYLHTGLLARLENEAQLATVLAHECSHVHLRHGLRSVRDAKNKTAFYASLAAVTAGFGWAGCVVNLLGGVGTLAAVTGYSRELEREADAAGFQRYLAAGYDPSACARVFELLAEERRQSQLREPFFFGSHPRLQERIESFRELTSQAAAQPADQKRELGVATYEAQLARLLPASARAAAQAGDFPAALANVDRLLRRDPEQAPAHCLRGDILRRRGAEGDLPQAADHFRRALAQDAHLADAHRGLGLVCFKLGDKAAARTSLQRYLELAPAAADRAYMENYLQQCAP